MICRLRKQRPDIVRALFYLRGPVPPGAHLRWRDTDWRAQAWPLWAT